MTDLHIHTTNSDGNQTVAQLLQKAETAGLEYIAITDHQSVGAYTELENPEIRRIFSGKIIPGVELLFEHDGMINELLGYGIDPEIMAKTPFLQPEEKQRRNIEFLKNMYDRFVELGFTMRPFEKYRDELIATGLPAHRIIANDRDSELNKTAREKIGIVTRDARLKFWFNEMMSPNGKYYARQEYDTIETVSNAIRRAGGGVFMAHIFRTIPEPDAMRLLDYCVENKLIDGIEVYYRDPACAFTPAQVAKLETYCKKHNLLMSGGSDNHKIDQPLTNIDEKNMYWLEKVVTL